MRSPVLEVQGGCRVVKGKRALDISHSCNFISFMSRDTRLSDMLHVLLHMAGSREPMTSEQLAAYLDTNPVVVRRTMAGLREAGLVRSVKGHGGGWTIARDLASATLGDVYAALGAPALFAIGHRNENSTCLVERAVNDALDETLREAEAMVAAKLANITLADIAAQFGDRMSEFHDVMKRKTSHV